ncbi:hypothetical protein BROUX41_006109 [Berkeleyomyces rouxiae]|uniref:uncharacterized protein n=1 Tax=Berkeleyomyces rouxiae TaxID=2035830 RepID=UPI003B76CF89
MQPSLLFTHILFGLTAAAPSQYSPAYNGGSNRPYSPGQGVGKITSPHWTNTTETPVAHPQRRPTHRLSGGLGKRDTPSDTTPDPGFKVTKPLLLNPDINRMSYREFAEPLRAYIPDNSAIVVKNENGNLWIEPVASVVTVTVTQATPLPTSTGTDTSESGANPEGPDDLPQAITDSGCLKHFLGISAGEPVPDNCAESVKRALSRRGRTYRPFGSHEREGQDTAVSPMDHSGSTWRNHTLAVATTASLSDASTPTAEPAEDPDYGRLNHPGWYNGPSSRHSKE